MAGKPPLSLQAEVVYPDGSTARWDRDSRESRNRPGGITFRTKRYTGFGDAQFALPRRIDLDYPDLGLLRGIALIGHDGSVAYDGRISAQPRSLQGTPSIGIQAQGWMAHASDEAFAEVFVDRDLSKWTSPSRRRTVELVTGNFNLSGGSLLADESGSPAVELAFSGTWAAPYKPLSEMWWLPQSSIQLGVLFYNFKAFNATMSPADLKWTVAPGLGATDSPVGLGSSDTLNLWPTPKTGYLAATGARTAAFVQLDYSETPAGIASGTFYAHLTQLAVYGTHGLTRRGEDPGGFYVSDMMRWIAQQVAPKLDTSGIQETTFPVPHASFLTDTSAYDAWQTLNAYHRWEMDVYEGRRLNYYPISLSDWDWEVRLSDPGTTVELQGDDTANLCNGVIVRYTDLTTGYEKRLTPETTSALKDESPDNPANEAGVKLYTLISLSVPSTEEGAIQIGRIFLAEFNQAQSPGTITVTGHIRDRAGHWQQGWKVRSSDRLIVSDLPNESVRVVGETEWNHDAKTLKIAVDSSFKRLDAVLARLGIAVQASNVSLP